MWSMQFALLCLGTRQFMVSLLARFGLLEWCLAHHRAQQQEGAPAPFEELSVGAHPGENLVGGLREKQRLLLRECLAVLVMLVTELPRLKEQWPAELRREVVQRLAVGPCSYSEVERSASRAGSSCLGWCVPDKCWKQRLIQQSCSAALGS